MADLNQSSITTTTSYAAPTSSDLQLALPIPSGHVWWENISSLNYTPTSFVGGAPAAVHKRSTMIM